MISIPFQKPLRDARLVSVGSAASAQAEVRAREREQAAFERGRHEGEKALSEQLLRQRSELLELQNGVLASLQQSMARVTQECEGALVALALEIAGKLVAGTPIASEMVEAAVREALAQVEQQGRLTVLLHPADFELLQRANAPVLLTEVGAERVSFQSSPNLSRGGCLVRTCFGILDARRETKLEALKQSLESSCN